MIKSEESPNGEEESNRLSYRVRLQGSKGKPNLLFNFQGLSEKQLNSTETNYGGVAQLGEHLPCKQRVMGSNPIISTKWDRRGKKQTTEAH